MNPWLYLTAAIAGEIAGTTALKLAVVRERPVFYVAVVLGYAVAFGALSRAVQQLPIGTAYAIWAAVGTLGAALAGYWLFEEKLGAQGLLGLALTIAGVVVLRRAA